MYSPIISVYFTIPFAKKEYVKSYYKAKWSPSNKKWYIEFYVTREERIEIHEQIINLSKYLDSFCHSITSIDDRTGCLDEYKTYEMIFSSKRPKEQWEIEEDDVRAFEIAISHLIDPPTETYTCCVIDDEIIIRPSPIVKASETPKIVNRCMDCEEPITWGTYVRCFNCNRDRSIKMSNEYFEDCLIE
jgi:hypothetical protein